MEKSFNTDGYCDPELHYMVDLSSRLREIKVMVDAGKYFTINRARQYGKTTVLTALASYLKNEYEVVNLDFQSISYADFEYEQNFVAAFSRELLGYTEHIPLEVKADLQLYSTGKVREATLSMLFHTLSELCEKAERKIVLIIDEIDSASNNQVFIDFLAQLRAYYLKRRRIPVFQSVILAGVYDVRNIRRKIRADEEHKTNSPWNTREGNESNECLHSFDDCPRDHRLPAVYDIAADFLVDMSFSAEEIAEMLKEYENVHHTGMDILQIAELLYQYTSGYPYLVSRLCVFMDERIPGSAGFPDKSSAWTRAGFIEAEKRLVNENNTLYSSLIGKLTDYPELKRVLHELLFAGKPIPYTATNDYIDVASMFGFIKNDNGSVMIANRIFESVLYNYFISEVFATSEIYDVGVQEKNQFIVNGHLDIRKVLERFVYTFDYLYGDQNDRFYENDGRKYFMLFLKPIINGIGSCNVESETRNRDRMDLVVEYRGEQSIIEIKIWRGNAYNERGEEQLVRYLDYFHLKKGYMLSFNFNKKKEIGVKEIILGDKLLIEAVV